MERVLYEVKRVVVGQDRFLERVLVAMLSQGHLLVEGVPGLAKTLTVKTLAQTLRGQFKRIQFTPDLVPADLVGTRIYNQKTGDFSTTLGPVFTNLLLADEINRAPAKVQSALLEVMQERQVTIAGTTHRVPEPFLVMATQNPIETEGTYPLPEAQVDRFMMKLKISYPSRLEEGEILDRMLVARDLKASPVLERERLLALREVADAVYLDAKIRGYILDLVTATRDPRSAGLRELTDLIAYGASPRATLYLARAAKAMALVRGRGYVIPEDVKELAADVLRHRIILTYEAEAEEKTAEDLIRRLFEQVEVP
jgi:MoxR-like ATPase